MAGSPHGARMSTRTATDARCAVAGVGPVPRASAASQEREDKGSAGGGGDRNPRTKEEAEAQNYIFYVRGFMLDRTGASKRRSSATSSVPALRPLRTRPQRRVWRTVSPLARLIPLRSGRWTTKCLARSPAPARSGRRRRRGRFTVVTLKPRLLVTQRSCLCGQPPAGGRCFLLLRMGSSRPLMRLWSRFRLWWLRCLSPQPTTPFLSRRPPRRCGSA